MPELLTLSQACQLLNCHKNTLRQWDRQGLLKAIRFGPRGDRRYRRFDLEKFLEPEETNFPKSAIPFFSSPVSAGFPSPAEDFIEQKLDLNEFLIDRPASTFLVRVKGDSMINAGINEGDILVVDRSLEPKNNTIIVAVLDNEFTVKRVKTNGKELYLIAENPKYKPIIVNEAQDFAVWGVVKYSIKPINN